MAKIKAGEFTIMDVGTIPVYVDSMTEGGDFVVLAGAGQMTAQQARDFAAVLNVAADKAEILTAAMEG